MSATKDNYTHEVHFKECEHIEEITQTHLEMFYTDKWYCAQCDADNEVAEIKEIEA